MSKIFFVVLVAVVSISMAFAQEQEAVEKQTATCLARGSECLGSNLSCCKPTTCMFYANRCVGDGLIIPDEPEHQAPEVAVEEKPLTCLARGSECVGSTLSCCKPTTCMFYANRCVGDGLIIPDDYKV